jgi:hypothetical protein
MDKARIVLDQNAGHAALQPRLYVSPLRLWVLELNCPKRLS